MKEGIRVRRLFQSQHQDGVRCASANDPKPKLPVFFVLLDVAGKLYNLLILPAQVEHSRGSRRVNGESVVMQAAA